MQEHRRDQRKPAICALLVTSDTRRPENDETGKLAVRLLEEDGHRVVIHMILKNDAFKIREALKSLLNDKRIQVIIMSGGTGISQKDRTVDTVTTLLNKRVNGFGELFRRLSYEEIGPTSILSRATAGIADGKLVFCLPGSRSAMELGLRRIILPAIGHMLWEMNRR